MIESLEGTERCLITRRILPAGTANIYENLPRGLKDTISEVHYVDGEDPSNKGKIGTYGIDLDETWIERIENTATNLVDLIKISDHGLGRWPEPDVEKLVSEHPLSALKEERVEGRWGPDQAKFWLPGWTLDQGSEGACVGFSNTQFLNAEPIRATFDNAYARGVYHRAQQIDPWPGEDYSGTSVQAGMDVLFERGLTLKPGWTNGWDEFMSWLSNVGPLVLGMDWHEGMHRPDANGFIHPTGRITGGHAILCHERLKDLIGVRLQNTWSPNWGVYGGCCFLNNEDLRNLMGRGGFVAGALVQVGEEKPEPKPPEPDPPKPDPEGEYRPGVHRQGLASFNRLRGELLNQEHVLWTGRQDNPVEIGRFIPKRLDK